MIPLQEIFLGNSGNPIFGGFGPNAVIIKDGILGGGTQIPGTGNWTPIMMSGTGKILHCAAQADSIDYDGQTITALQHIWINAYCGVQINDRIGPELLGFRFISLQFGTEYKSIVGFVGGFAISVFSDEMYQGDQLCVVGQSNANVNLIDGDFCITTSLLP